MFGNEKCVLNRKRYSPRILCRTIICILRKIQQDYLFHIKIKKKFFNIFVTVRLVVFYAM